MEKKLRSLFEYQKFEQNPRLAAMLAETEARETMELSDAALELVAAAGEIPNAQGIKEKKGAEGGGVCAD